ncbi:MAG: D-alanyl-D-alanine carboxypeptidase family protein [Eubacteriales bacterium]
MRFFRCVCLVSVILVFFLFSTYRQSHAVASPPVVTADAAVLLDAGTGQVLFAKNAYQRRPPASTTKIMTALLALEGGDLRQVVEVSRNAASVGESSINLWAGEKISLEDLVYGAMLESGNDACVAISEQIAGTEANFIAQMNQKAKLLGARDTNFKNTNGLPAAGHFSTAYDLAAIARYALTNKLFASIVSTKERAIGIEYRRRAMNTNGLLWSYPGADGVKTGTTNEAGQCLVASATKDGRRLISTVLHSGNRYGDSAKLLDFGFKEFEYVKAVGKGEPFCYLPVNKGDQPVIPVVAEGDICAAVLLGRSDLVKKTARLVQDLDAPVARGQVVGEVEVSVDGSLAGKIALISDSDVHALPKYRILYSRMVKFLGN